MRPAHHPVDLFANRRTFKEQPSAVVAQRLAEASRAVLAAADLNEVTRPG